MLHEGLTDIIENTDYEIIAKANEIFEEIDEITLQSPGIHKLF